MVSTSTLFSLFFSTKKRLSHLSLHSLSVCLLSFFFLFTGTKSSQAQVYVDASTYSCYVGDYVDFYGDDYSGYNVVNWEWDFNDGDYDYSQNSYHAFTSPGTYYVYLTVTYDDYTTDYDYVVINVMANTTPPYCDFDINPNPATEGSTVYFTDYSTGDPTSWYWDFDDGGTSYSQNPTHTFATAGTYYVKLTVTNADGSDTWGQNVVVDPAGNAPTAFFDINPNPASENSPVSFTDQSTDSPTSWDWDFGDGGTSTLQNPNHTYSSAGSYYVTLTVTNSNGSDTYGDNVVVDPAGNAPTAFFDVNPNPATENATIYFTDQSTDSPSTWLWDFGDGTTSSQQNPTHTYASAGSYYVTLTATNGNGSDTYGDNVVVDPAEVTPTANFDFTPASPVNVGDNVDFNDLSTNAGSSPTYYWDFGDGSYSYSQNPSHTYYTAGTYNISLTISNTAGSDTYQATIVVDEAPTVPVAYFYMDTYYGTAPLTVNVTDQSSGVPTSWSWDFGDPTDPNNTSSSSGPLSFTYQNPGNYIASLTVSNASGTDTYTTEVIVVSGTDVMAQFATDVTSGDAPLTVQFVDWSTNNPTSWSWDFGDPTNSNNTSTSNGPLNFTYNTPGDYVVSLTVNNSTSTDTYTTLISVKTPGSNGNAAFSSDVTTGNAPLTVYFTDESTNYPSTWDWDFGNGETSIDQNPSTTYANPGTYVVTLQVDFSSSVSHTIIVNNSSLAPVAQFTADVYQGTAPLTVNFTDLTTNNPTAWNWDMGDYNNSEEQNTTYTFASPGTYVVTLTADNTDGSSTYSATINVTNALTSFTFDTNNGPAPLTVNFTDLSVNATDWEWNFGNPNDASGNISYAQNPAYTFTAPGIYTVKLKAGSFGITDSTTNIIQVDDANDDYFDVYSKPEGTNDSILVYSDHDTYGQKISSTQIISSGSAKICADGTKSTVIIFTPSALDPNKPYANLAGRMLNNGSYPDAATGKVISVSYSGGKLRVTYKAPEYVDLNHTTDQIILYNSATMQPYYLADVRFYNAPVVYVNDLYSSGTSATNLRSVLPFPQWTNELKDITNYYYSNDGHIDASANELKAEVDRKIRSCAESYGYTCGKVDIVGHGSGGIVARRYIESFGGDKLVHKLITVNTPHAGSVWMNLLVQTPGLYCEMDYTETPPKQKCYSKIGPLIQKQHNLSGNPTGNGCPADLATNSYFLQALNSGNNCNGIACHAITTQYLPSVSLGTGWEFTLKNWLIDKALGGLPLAFDFLGSFYKDLHTNSVNGGPETYLSNDLEVAVISQEGGLSAKSNFVGVKHNMSISNTNVINRIKTLLQADPNNTSLFDKGGFHPVTIGANSNYSKIGSVESSTFAPTVGAVNIISPAQNIIVSPGDLVPVTISSSGARKNINVIVANNDRINISRGQDFVIDSTTKYLSFMYKVPQNYCGYLRISAIAYDSLALGFSSDSVYLIVNTNNLVLDSISVSPQKLLILKTQKSNISVTGHFAGVGPVDITSLTNITYSSANSSIASSLNTGIYKGNNFGGTAGTVFYKGKTKQIQIKVVDSLTYANSNIVTAISNNTFTEDAINNLAIKVYPNPSAGLTYIDYTLENTDKVQLDVLDINGKIIKTISYYNQLKGPHNQQLDISSFANGLYVIKIQSGGKTGYSKLSIIK